MVEHRQQSSARIELLEKANLELKDKLFDAKECLKSDSIFRIFLGLK